MRCRCHLLSVLCTPRRAEGSVGGTDEVVAVWPAVRPHYRWFSFSWAPVLAYQGDGGPCCAQGLCLSCHSSFRGEQLP